MRAFCRLLLIALAPFVFSLLGCRLSSAELRNNSRGKYSRAATCADIPANDVEGCSAKDASEEVCAYNFSTGTCIEAPQERSWPEQAVAAGSDYVCAINSNGKAIRCFSTGEAGGTALTDNYPAVSGTWQTVSAVGHGHAYEMLTATNSSGQIFSAGQDGRTHKDMQRWTDFSSDSRMAFATFNGEVRCSVNSPHGTLECKKASYSDTVLPQGLIRPLLVAYEYVNFCVIDDKFALQCFGPVATQDPFQSGIPKGQIERVALTPGGPHACAIKWSDNKLMCWSEVNNALSSVINNVPKDVEARSIAVSQDFALAIDRSGKLHWWGNASNADAALVRDDILALGHKAMRAVVAGDKFACAVSKEDDELICFGSAGLKASLATYGKFIVKKIADIRFAAE